MTVNEYVKKIAKAIKCDSKKKNDIKKQLLSDIQEKQNQGMSVEQIIEQMGTVEEIAEGFNESLSDDDKKKYKKSKMIKILVTIIAVVGVLALAMNFAAVRTSEIANSKYFTESALESASMQIIDLMDAEEYASIDPLMDTKMQKLNASAIIKTAKDAISPNFGERKNIGQFYMLEVKQLGVTSAVVEVKVNYDNAIVVYRLSFNKNMELAGLYLFQ